MSKYFDEVFYNNIIVFLKKVKKEEESIEKNLFYYENETQIIVVTFIDSKNATLVKKFDKTSFINFLNSCIPSDVSNKQLIILFRDAQIRDKMKAPLLKEEKIKETLKKFACVKFGTKLNFLLNKTELVTVFGVEKHDEDSLFERNLIYVNENHDKTVKLISLDDVVSIRNELKEKDVIKIEHFSESSRTLTINDYSVCK